MQRRAGREGSCSPAPSLAQAAENQVLRKMENDVLQSISATLEASEDPKEREATIEKLSRLMVEYQAEGRRHDGMLRLLVERAPLTEWGQLVNVLNICAKVRRCR